MNPVDFIYILFAYLLGSVSSAILVSRIFYDVDIRGYGSKNPGANNVQRVFGWKAGLIVLLFDFLKGVLAVNFIHFCHFSPDSDAYVGFQIGLGMAAVLGHIFPIFFGFKGGKGVSTICGVLCAIHPWTMLFCLGVFLLVFFITRYISVSVIAAITCYPFIINSVFALWLQPNVTLTLQIFSIVIAIIIWLTHISNLKRLWNGTEEKFILRRPIPPDAPEAEREGVEAK